MSRPTKEESIYKVSIHKNGGDMYDERRFQGQLAASYKNGLEAGIAEGREEGRAEGREAGLAEGLENMSF